MDAPVSPAVVTALEPLPRGYHHVVNLLLGAAGSDDRVRALWLGGSVGRGAADAGSDLDVLIAVADHEYDGFCAGWRDWLDSVIETIIAAAVPGVAGCFATVTTDCERLDLVVERASDVSSSPYRSRLVALDKDDLDAVVPAPDDSPRGPDPTVVAALVEEFFRQQAIFPAAVVAREDWLLGVVGVMTAQQLLYRLFVEANQPLPMMGVKQWSSRLSGEQRAVLESLPVPRPNRDETVTAMLAVRTAMLTHGRAAAERSGLAWPSRIDDAVAAFYARELGGARSSSASPAADSSRSTSATTRMANPEE